jgi:phospholipid transport system substrate-binding protein
MNKFIKKLVQISMLLVLAVPAWAGEVESAEKRVVDVTTNIVRLLDANLSLYEQNEAALTAMVRKEVLPFIDFEAMSKLTLGRYWTTASAQQRTRFINAFREMLVRSYAKTMLEYSGSKIRGGNSAQNTKPGYVIVRTVVIPKGSSPIAANYSVRSNSGDWKAYNVEISGINLITNFRTNFTREVGEKGLEALITRLENTGK